MLEVAGEFTTIGNLVSTSYARFNGWYWDLSYHVYVISPSLYLYALKVFFLLIFTKNKIFLRSNKGEY